MKFIIYWTECHNPDNWGDTREEGIKNICDSLPTKSWANDSNDGWIRVECEDTFEAENIKEAKKYVEDNYEDVVVFNVYIADIQFTEEDL